MSQPTTIDALIEGRLDSFFKSALENGGDINGGDGGKRPRRGCAEK